MNVHLLYPNSFIGMFCSNLQKTCPQNNVLCIITKDIQNYEEKFPDLVFKYVKDIDQANEYIQSEGFEKIFLHYLHWGFRKIIDLQKGKKIYWIYWGGEVNNLYSIKFLLLPKTRKLFALYPFFQFLECFKNPGLLKYVFFKPWIRTEMKKRLKYITAVLHFDEAEIEIVRKKTGVNLAWQHFQYGSVDNLKSNKEIELNKTDILIGNSASIINNHLDFIYEFKNDLNKFNKLIIPMSYPNDKFTKFYISKILKELGNLKSKTTILTKFIPETDYYNLIASVKCVSNYSIRSAGMANLLSSGANGAVILINKKSPVASLFEKLNIRYITDLKNETITIEQNESLLNSYSSAIIQTYYKNNFI